MDTSKVQPFQLSGESILRRSFFRSPPDNVRLLDAAPILYHYTSGAGLQGILRDGGLRATFRLSMTDEHEFEYARNLVYDALDDIHQDIQLPKYVQRLAEYTRKILYENLTCALSRKESYCACLTINTDRHEHWETYACKGTGCAIGFSVPDLLKSLIQKVERGEENMEVYPVIYDERVQRQYVHDLIDGGVRDIGAFAESDQPVSLKDLNAFCRKVGVDISCALLIMIDAMKADGYAEEREVRLFLSTAAGAQINVRPLYFTRSGESIPYIFLDMRSPRTGRLPLAEILIGPNCKNAEEEAFVEGLLDELGYGTGGHLDRPVIVKPSLA